MVSYQTFKASRKTPPKNKKKTDNQYPDKLDYSEIEFPASVKQYNRIGKQNNINVNVFGYEEKQPFPIYLSKEHCKEIGQVRFAKYFSSFSIDFLDNLKKIMGRNHKSHMGSPYQSVFTFILMQQEKLDRFIKRANYLRPTIKLMAEISEN